MKEHVAGQHILRKMVVSENLLKDIYWTPYQASIKLEKLCTCWSTPILSARGTLYGRLQLIIGH